MPQTPEEYAAQLDEIWTAARIYLANKGLRGLTGNEMERELNRYYPGGFVQFVKDRLGIR